MLYSCTHMAKVSVKGMMYSYDISGSLLLYSLYLYCVNS